MVPVLGAGLIFMADVVVRGVDDDSEVVLGDAIVDEGVDEDDEGDDADKIELLLLTNSRYPVWKLMRNSCCALFEGDDV